MTMRCRSRSHDLRYRRRLLGLPLALLAFAQLFLVTTVAEAAVTYRLSWEGQFEQFRIDGFFGYRPADVPADGIVRAEQLQSFNFTIADGNGEPLRTFKDNHLVMPGFNFNFDTNTGEILQRGRWDAPDGINIGDERFVGLNFWSIDQSLLAGPDEPDNPHTHVTDWGDEFTQYPIAFAGVFAHIDGAFFERTAAQVLGDPTAGNELGQPLTAVVPVPAALPLLATAMVALGVIGRRRRAAVTNA